MAWVPFLALVLWFPVVFVLFEKFPVQKAIVFAFITAWLFLPPTLIPVSGFPDWSKTTATVVSVTICCWLKQPQRMTAIHPRWYDLPIIVYCLIPFIPAVMNGTGAYEGLSACLEEIVRWGLPYLVGRAYLGTPAGNRQICLGMAVGGMLYVPLCLVEIRMSPQLKGWVYGFTEVRIVDFGLRYGGYRPVVFLATGLEVGWWMCCASLAAIMLWRSGSIRRLQGYPMWALTLVLCLVTVACKSTGALVQIAMAIVLIYASRMIKSSLLVWALIAVGPCYCVNRPLGFWNGESIVSWSSSIFGSERAESLAYRFNCEERLFQSALLRPVFGWGRFGGFNPPDASGKKVVTDGLWIIVFGGVGGVGVATLNAMLLIPSALFLVRNRPKTWFDREVAPMAALALILPMFMIDNLSNAMLNPIYAIAMGSLSGCFPGRRDGLLLSTPAVQGLVAGESKFSPLLIGVTSRRGGTARDLLADRLEEDAVAAAEADQDELARALFTQAIRARRSAADASQRPDRLDRLASTHVTIARYLAKVGDPLGAIDERERALEIWARLRVAGSLAGPSLGGYAANLNDLAWRLIEHPLGGTDQVNRAMSLVEEALGINPEQSTYWNTLGIVFYRRGDFYKAIHALSQAVGRSPNGGNAFDFYYLALANHALGYSTPATDWLIRADGWSEQHPDWDPLLRAVRDEVERTMRPRLVG